MLSEAVLHQLELLYTIYALGFLLREDETRERFAELGTASSVGHTTEAGTVPVDLTRDGIERTSGAFAVFCPFGSLGCRRRFWL